MRSSLIDTPFRVPYCQSIFGAEIGEPAVDAVNTKYGGLDIDAKNIVFVNAIEDPWQYAGMRKIEHPDTQTELEAILIDCNSCGHCVDLSTPADGDTPGLRQARDKIKNTLAKWLNPTPPSKNTLFLQE